ncbi:helix-turn-helix domain-containing protein [Sphingomicrobium flavum]|uniref:helix-turn-helix domain-containing protein n=1 Tax=Sphingomicrobium flavum TaxID=1229164 RepID=UPI0021AE19C4|nr:helix-turn-helix transcriptional regulator [Sphingomicrobium flavum]
MVEFEQEMVADRIKLELARRRISRQALADKARISLSTLEKSLSGSRQFTLNTVVRLEDALDTRLRDARQTAPVIHHECAPDRLGAYSHASVRWIEGDYLTLRASFSEEGGIYAYRTSIAWDAELGYLTFKEGDRIDGDFAQRGAVSMPRLSGHTYLVTEEAGQYRMAMLSRPNADGKMYGLLSTLQVGTGSQLVPISCPIALVPLAKVEPIAMGAINAGHPAHSAYRAILDKGLEQDFCRLRK